MPTKDAALFSPDQGDFLWEALNKLFTERGLTEANMQRGDNIPPNTPLYFRNDSGETIPAFAAMQATGNVDMNGQNYFIVNKPVDRDGTAGPFLFNLFNDVPAASSGAACVNYGVATAGPSVRVLSDVASPAAGDKLSPQAGSWKVAAGGTIITATGADDIRADVIRGTVGGGGGAAPIVEFAIVSADGYLTADGESYVDGGPCHDDGNPADLKGEIIRYPCGATSVPGQDANGYIDLVDDLGWTNNRTRDELLGRKGYAVRLSADGYGSKYDRYGDECVWAIIIMNFFRERRVCVDVIKTATKIIFKFEKVMVFDHCTLQPYEIPLSDCPPSDYYDCY